MQSIVLDTNILMEYPEIIKKLINDYNIILSIVIIEELDNLKIGQYGNQAREAIRNINDNLENITVDREGKVSLLVKNDNAILSCAKKYNASICTLDLNMKIKAKALGIEYFDVDLKNEVYKGYKEIILDNKELAKHYENPENKWNLLDNEYLIIKNINNEIVDKQRWTNYKGFLSISSRGFKSLYFGEVKPKDDYQMLAIDSLNNTDFTLFYGMAGSAKTFLSLSYIMQNIQNNKLSKCVIIFNNVPLKNNQAQGFYPGTRTDKILQGGLGGILSSKFGDILSVETLINQGKLMIIPTCDIRGIEIASNDCLFVTEGQNIDTYTMRTILQRAKEGCKIIIEGDLREQNDLKCSNSMLRIMDIYKGTKYFSCVELKNSYRNPIGVLAQKL